jgi:phenylpyruvate tautomerase PptA (4-oxalocrotonate tautomerase family)
MPFVEVFAPHGSVDPEQQTRISTMLVAEVMRAEGAPATEPPRSSSWTDVKYWPVFQPTDSSEQAHYVVRINVPAASMTDEKRAEIVARVTKVLADTNAHRFRPARRPTAWVQIIEVAGTDGRVVRFAEIAAGDPN